MGGVTKLLCLRVAWLCVCVNGSGSASVIPSIQGWWWGSTCVAHSHQSDSTGLASLPVLGLSARACHNLSLH